MTQKIKNLDLVRLMRSCRSRSTAVALMAALAAHCVEARPKVTQAEMVSFASNSVCVLSAEEFGKPIKLMFMSDGKSVHTEYFGEFGNDSFSYVNPVLRFKSFTPEGLGMPVVVAVLAMPGYSDAAYDCRIIGETNGVIASLTDKTILLGSSQDGFYIGHINERCGSGLVIWESVWGDGEAHYAPHRYKIAIHRWGGGRMAFRPMMAFTTAETFKDGFDALRRYRLPCRNMKDEVAGGAIGTLGIEDVYFSEGNTPPEIQ